MRPGVGPPDYVLRQPCKVLMELYIIHLDLCKRCGDRLHCNNISDVDVMLIV